MNKRNAVWALGGTVIAAGAAAGIVVTSSPAMAGAHSGATTTDYPPVIVTATVAGESTSRGVPPTSALTDPAGTVEASSTSRGAVATPDSTGGGDLPFTGADVAGAGIVGLALIGGGGVLVIGGRRRRGAHR